MIEVARGLLFSMHVPKDFSLCLQNKKYHTFVKKGEICKELPVIVTKCYLEKEDATELP